MVCGAAGFVITPLWCARVVLSEAGPFVRESLSEVASLSESLCHVVHEPRARSYERKRTVPS
jgi:hypothetical protein